ncbi:hypothetical protein [Bradyrhizobium sp.]|uniref:hypothetical protein n=1 Tax=Bradyrhizobium sp. TaxID=376 RepID=UPI002D2848ED|nr:hypothetical protein [Bradyrhizobium sp.]HZR76031.1 hypothetical protein [Bradyrhizobium sp.]
MSSDVAGSGQSTLMRSVTRLPRAILRRGRNVARRGAGAVLRVFRPPVVAGPPPEPTRITVEQLAGFGDQKAVVFFAPEAGIVPHYVAHSLVAKTLKERGHRVLIIRCFDVYPRCIVMDAAAIAMEPTEQERLAVCASCRQAANSMTGAYGLDVLDLQDLIDDDVRKTVDRLMTDLPEDLSTFEFEGARLGQFCGAMAAVTFKVTDFTGADPAVRSLLLKYLKGSLFSYLAMQRLVRLTGIARVIYFNQYAILMGAALAARQAGIATTNLSHATIRAVDRRRLLFMTQPLSIATFRQLLKEWPDWRSLALSREIVKEVCDDLIYRMSSNSMLIYSPVRSGTANDLFDRLELDPNRRVLVAFTSSLDEIGANNRYLEAMGMEPFPEKQPFRDQIEWLEALVAKVEASPDLQLVIRTHPREGANRRDAVIAGHLGLLKERFSGPFKHVRVVWAEDKISSYDLMELADVGLSAWSFTALEMARLGVPTVVAFDLHTPYPIGDVVLWAESAEGYFACLEQALQRGPSIDPIRFAYRWTHLRILGCSIDVGDVVPNSDASELPPYRTPKAAAAIEEVVVGGRSALDLNRDKLLAIQGGEAKALEREELNRQIRRCVRFLCTGEDRSDDFRLFYASKPGISVPEGYDAVVVDDGALIEWRMGGHSARRRSRMAKHLSMFGAQNIGISVQ